jgi:formamidopyrimidine-DNA glycosylase
MPELPEVETTIRYLKRKVLKRTFLDVWTDAEKIVKKPKGFANFKKDIKGERIVNIKRRAKNIIFELSNGMAILVHQKMTGHLLVGKWEKKSNKWLATEEGALQDKDNSYIHLMFWLSGGLMMALSDLRKFAKVELWRAEELKQKLNSELGPEPLLKSFSFDKFKARILIKNIKIKQALMDPFVIAGIGNIYSDEALWRAKIHPFTKPKNIGDKDLKNLFLAVKDVLKKGIKLGGESFADYRKPDGAKGSFDIERRAYGRAGQKCFRCGLKMAKLKMGGRTASYCPHCQKLL